MQTTSTETTEPTSLFDAVVNRCGTGSLKWDKYKGSDIIPMWIADMDFKSPKAVRDALHDHIDQGVYGYTLVRDEVNEVVITRLKEKYNWDVKPEWLVWLPSLVPGLHLACLAAGEHNDEVLTFTPVYPPFLRAPEKCHRELVTVPLTEKDGLTTFDLEAFKKAITPKTKLLMLCNPHNPVGRVFQPDELKAIAEICLENDIIISSDEIHCDLILDDLKHTPLATLDERYAQITMTLLSPGKTFNMPGLNCGFAVIPNDKLRHRFESIREGIVPWVNVMGYTACMAAYRDCQDWHDELISYLQQNRQLLIDFIAEVPCLKYNPGQATYLAWIDARELPVDDAVKFFEAAGVGLEDGALFGMPGFVRLNFGCPRSTMTEALNRMKKALKSL
ncbi:MAG: PatB family C-S lyase [Phycisphaerae bacterium]|nr:PatB family C-S lyase [Phycisphaerae bacterium]